MTVADWIAIASVLSLWILSGIGLIVWAVTFKTKTQGDLDVLSKDFDAKLAVLTGKVDLLDAEVGHLRDQLGDFATHSVQITRVEEQIKSLTKEISSLTGVMKPIMTMIADKMKTS